MINLSDFDLNIGKIIIENFPEGITEKDLKWKFAVAIKYDLDQLEKGPQHEIYDKRIKIIDRYEEPLEDFNEKTGLFEKCLPFFTHTKHIKMTPENISKMKEALQNSVNAFEEEMPKHFKCVELFQQVEMESMLQDISFDSVNHFEIVKDFYIQFHKDRKHFDRDYLIQLQSAQIAALTCTIAKIKQDFTKFKKKMQKVKIQKTSKSPTNVKKT
jgi:hypothetical protein